GDRAVGSNVYRSPWPMLLADGRILVLFARRRFPYGIGGTISEDGGKTWSEEFVIRAGGCSVPDIGYPVACQLEDGRIFTAYYYNMPGGTRLTSVRYIAGTFFRVKASETTMMPS
ncbi:MAG: exo-alpha-sialidase, partial [Phycisphaerae bacterium]|nr:exo-alpha-sialidase [Phycisphaerae bacterium]